MTAPPLIGLTLDAEQQGDYSRYPFYALRVNYAEAIAAAGGLPVGLPHNPALTGAYLDRISALVVTGGAFDIHPDLYGESSIHPSVVTKEDRTAAELALVLGAIERGLPVLGVCGGQQLLAVALGGTLIQHIPDHIPNALPHEQPNPRHEAGHSVEIRPGTRLAQIVGASVMQVNSSHHQAVLDPGPRMAVSAVAEDGVIEAVEALGLPFCIGVQWHLEFLIDPGDRRIFEALIGACA